ncbi:putative E3 ubiquitin-protein ligase HERC2 like protein [Argiope bruennichi]|uniref:Putative E3 ubiquitin-protein ligase HERC2 like protein n=1 Tax=Argiope bruennichi TaxID=94029 RepID=A0A8T0FD25_ARGBR|nr:putative E3 ubiquitin-protein ligase HERC2 like protein [Argiope bruennichi]
MQEQLTAKVKWVANEIGLIKQPDIPDTDEAKPLTTISMLMGIAMRTGSPLSLNLAEPVWKQLTGMALTPTDLTEVDKDYVAGLISVRYMEPDTVRKFDLPFSTHSTTGTEVPLSSKYSSVTPENRIEYIRLALSYRLHEFDEQVSAVREGMSKVIPVPLLSLFTGSELETMNPFFNVHVFKGLSIDIMFRNVIRKSRWNVQLSSRPFTL